MTKEKKEQFRKQIKVAKEMSHYHEIDIALKLLEALLLEIDQLEADKIALTSQLGIIQDDKALAEHEVADGCRHIARLSIDLGKANAASSYARAETLKAQADRDELRQKYEIELGQAKGTISKLEKENDLLHSEGAAGNRLLLKLSAELGQTKSALAAAENDRDHNADLAIELRAKFEDEKERADRLQQNWENEKAHVADMREAVNHGGELARENQRLEMISKGLASTNKRLWEVLSKAFNKIPGWDEEYRALLREPVFPAVAKIQKMEEIVNLVILNESGHNFDGRECPGCKARLRIVEAIKEYQAL